MSDLNKVVLLVAQDTITITCSDKSKFKMLKKIGAKRGFLNRHNWRLKYNKKIELSRFFSSLRDHDFVFSGGSSGWTPSTVFQNLKSDGYLDGHALEVVWKNNETYIFREI